MNSVYFSIPIFSNPIAVPLNDAALMVLRRRVGQHVERVFTYRGKPLKAANTMSWQHALKRAGIEDFRWHDLRHTWATWQRQAGTPTHELQKLGHGGVPARWWSVTPILRPSIWRWLLSRIDPLLSGYTLATVGPE